MFKRIEQVVGGLGALILFLLMTLTFMDVVGRNAFNRPIASATELTEILLASLIFLLLPSVSFRQKHIVVDLIDSISTNATFRRIQNVLGALVGFAMFGIIAYRLWFLAGRAAGYNDVTPLLALPMAPLIYGMSLMCFITAIVFLSLIFRPVELEVQGELLSEIRLAEDAVKQATMQAGSSGADASSSTTNRN